MLPGPGDRPSGGRRAALDSVSTALEDCNALEDRESERLQKLAQDWKKDLEDTRKEAAAKRRARLEETVMDLAARGIQVIAQAVGRMLGV